MIFELIKFIDSDHQYVFLISSSTKSKFVEVTLNQFKSSTSTDTKSRTRTTSEISKHSRFWFLNWAIDKSLFKKAVKRFESCFSKLISNKKFSEDLSIIKQSKHISMSEQDSFSFNIENSNEFFSAQLIDLIRLISQVLDSRQSNININVNFESHSSQSSDDVFDHRQFKDWSAEEIEFFDSVAKETNSIVNVEKHVLYKNVYAFTDRLKNMTIIKEDSKLKLIIFQCLRESTLIWHSIELFTLKKEMLRDASLINWYNALIRRFKKRTSIVLISMQTIKYTMKNARLHKNLKIFAQNLFRSVKIANLISTHNQFTIAWNNLTWQFRQHISEFTEQTTMREFLEQLDSQISIWHEMITSNQSAFRKINKLFFQYQSDRNIECYRDDRSSYRNNNNNSHQKRNDRLSRMNIIIKIEKKSRRNEEKFIKNNVNRSFDRNKNIRNKNRNRYKNDRKEKDKENKNKDKTKIFVTAEKSAENDSELKNYHQFENLTYYDSNYNEKENQKKFESKINLTMITKVVCRRCKTFFFSKNALYKHLKICFNIKKAIRDEKENNVLSISKSAITTYAETVFSDVVIFILRFNIDANKNIEIDYDFKKWQYASTEVTLSSNTKLFSECLNTEAEIILIDISFFKTQCKNTSIRTMTFFITIRGLDVNKHSTNKYVIIFMYFSSINKDENFVKTLIIREIHLIENLKANVLIDNDILNSEKFDIFISTSSAYIESCNVIILIFVNNRSSSRTISIHATKTMIISSKSEQTIFIHKISLSNRHYIFESANANFSIYSHIVDTTTNVILIRNDENRLIKIFRNFHLNKLIKLDYFNVYLIDNDLYDLIIRKSKSEHKVFWFQKMLTFHINTNKINIKSFCNNDVMMINDITAHNSFKEAITAFNTLINEYLKLWTDQDFVNFSEKNWMRLSLKFDWKSKVKNKVKIYSLDVKNKTVVDDTFNKLQAQERLSWTKKITSFNYSCFVVWRDSLEKKKSRIVIDIRNLNAISQSNAYSLSLQNDIIQTVQECAFISVIDCFSFFYQWRVHSDDRHKFTIMSHREQKTFNVIVMSYRNSSVYVQRQIDRILRFFDFVRAYVNDIVVFFNTLKNHLTHFRQIFQILSVNNISINLKKAFLSYSSVSFLKQHVTFLNLFTDEEKLQAIVNFFFFKTLNKLETYFELTEWFRQYIEIYATKFKSLQDKKTSLLKRAFMSEKIRKSYVSKIRINSIEQKLNSFKNIQESLFKFIYLVHFNSRRQFYVDLNSSKKIDIEAMIYHFDRDWKKKKSYSFRKSVRSFMFFSRLLNSVETRYWFIELEFAELIWILKKIRHLVKSTDTITIVYIDHDAALDIAKQTTLITSSIDRFNLRLIRASNYVQRFNLDIRHKFEKLHLISDALFRLSTKMSLSFHDENDKLNVLFTIFFVEMTSKFRDRIVADYVKNLTWKKIFKTLESSRKNNIELSFMSDNDLIYRKESNHNMSFTLRRLCISTIVVKDILNLIHDQNHSKFDKTYQQIVSSWYIQSFIKHIKFYIKHCSKCSVNQTRRHKSYDSLQSIFTSSISFHTIDIDFVFALSKSHIDINSIMSVICKFSKRVTAISKKNTWDAFIWTEALLQRLNIADWDFLKIIISNRDRKFLTNLWKSLFERLKIKLLYTTIYHSQANNIFERIN